MGHFAQIQTPTLVDMAGQVPENLKQPEALAKAGAFSRLINIGLCSCLTCSGDESIFRYIKQQTTQIWSNDMIHIHENMGDTLEFAESLGWVDDDGPDGDLTEESALDFIEATGYLICKPAQFRSLTD